MSDNGTAIVVAVIGASVTVVVAAAGGLASLSSTRRQRRRETYGKAIRAVTGWRELLYRVRRRAPDEDRQLRDLFHERQDELLYYEAWVATESEAMARSYRRFVREVKAVFEPLIREAWAERPEAVPTASQREEEHPDIDGYVDRFLEDARGSLSVWPWFRIGVWSRNRPGK